MNMNTKTSPALSGTFGLVSSVASGIQRQYVLCMRP
jgi:hypothetical protein